uniref:Uncharacterized protein n=1 Tax=Romanomermis culicivorax TaxID=13658 RepID=A0A915K6X5_ROMCU
MRYHVCRIIVTQDQHKIVAAIAVQVTLRLKFQLPAFGNETVRLSSDRRNGWRLHISSHRVSGHDNAKQNCQPESFG